MTTVVASKIRTIYFIRPVGQRGPVKIGCSDMPRARLKNLGAWAPFPLELAATAPGSLITERQVHSAFADYHSHGEWFHACAEIDAAITALNAGVPLAQAVDLTKPLANFRNSYIRYFSPARRKYLSYAARIRHAFKPLWRPGPDSLFISSEIDAVLSAWSKAGPHSDYIPSAEQLALLDDAITYPVRHAVPAGVRWPKAEAS